MLPRCCTASASSWLGLSPAKGSRTQLHAPDVVFAGHQEREWSQGGGLCGRDGLGCCSERFLLMLSSVMICLFFISVVKNNGAGCRGRRH